MFRVFAGIIVLISALSVSAAASTASLPPILVSGDEPVVATLHTIETAHGVLRYEARAGRLPIRDMQTGQVKGHVFFVAYVALNRGHNRPLTFAWNGGPVVPSIYLHTEFLGPRRLTEKGIVDNAETLLEKSDLVFYDPIETGFSRPENPGDAAEFLTMQGDVAEANEFIRAYRTRFGAEKQPLFLIGESYGVWRACAVADALTKKNIKLSGVVLISGDLPGIPMPLAFYDAMHIPARTATALYYKRLPPDLMRDPAATMTEAISWAKSTYLPALLHPERLSPADREKVAQDLARFTGMQASQVDRKTLVISASQFLHEFLGKGKLLSDIDSRQPEEGLNDPKSVPLADEYLRHELGYATDLVYSGVEDGGYSKTPGPGPKTMRAQWSYNEPGMTADILKKSNASWDPKYLASVMPPWIENAMRAEKNLKVFVATGRYDPLNMCEGDAIMAAKLAPDLSRRVTVHCYNGGHLMYRDDAARLQLSGDLSAFFAEAQ